MRTRLLVATAALITTGAFTVPLPAQADDPPGRTITVAGDLQSELGCPGDWQPSCPQSELTQTGPTSYAALFSLPAGSYQFKVTVNGSWDENYGADGVANGDNIPLVIQGPATLQFGYDDVSHRVSVAPTDLPGQATPADATLAGNSLRQPLTREQFYFVMTDRFANGDPANDQGGYSGGRLVTGYDPTHKGFYHGGDLKGLISKLDYIKGLGTTSIWLTPSFVNKPVQGPAGQETAGYHGYWITDFTHIDPHLGTNADMKALIDAAHAKGMRVFFDIITNHTADVIDYTQNQYSYRNKTDYPYRDVNGNPFDDRDYVNQPFPPMDASSFPYTPFFHSAEDANAKTPAWLNNPIYYHNRGDSTFAGESAQYGDFVGLDDLFTERPEVLHGMEDIYRAWVDLGIDGFRIDTAKHVNTEFWQQFSPAMLDEAHAVGTSKFFMFGEVFDADPAFQSIYSTTAKLPATLDFGFQQNAVAVANGGATTYLSKLFAGDDFYTDTDSNAYDLPTFLGNHDMGRIGRFVNGSLQRDEFAHALMYTLRGQPVVYYGDEQGFVGDGGDQDARQDMFASQVASYNDDPMIGGASGAMDRYNQNATVYRYLQRLSQLRKAYPALADGAQTTRFASDKPGIFAVSRVDRQAQVEYLVVANNAETTKTATFGTFTPSTAFKSIFGGQGGVSSSKTGQVTVTVPPLTVQVLQARKAIPQSSAAPAAYLAKPSAGGVLANRAEIRAAVPANTPVQASFAYRPVGTTAWQPLGTDDNAPYRVYQDVSGLAKGSLVEYRTVVKDNAGHLSASSSYGVVGDPPKPTGGGVGDVTQPTAVSVPGTTNSEMGCAGDWDPACAYDQLSLDANDKIWKGTWTLPAGTYSYKVAINNTWDENYGAGGVPNGGNIDLTSDGVTPITFYYDHRTHFVTTTAQEPIVVAPGSFQSEMGCPGDWDAGCMRSWLQDPDGDGTSTLSTTQIPPGSYEAKAAINLTWDENYGSGGVPNGANIPFTVPNVDGAVTTFSYNGTSHVLTVTSAAPGAKPDLSTAAAYWIDDRTIAYPLDRLAAGTDPAWLRFRLHWGTLEVDATGLGGSWAGVTMVPGGPDGYLALRLDNRTADLRDEILAAPMAAVGVYDDADALLDATRVAAP
jgi:glycosidase